MAGRATGAVRPRSCRAAGQQRQLRRGCRLLPGTLHCLCLAVSYVRNLCHAGSGVLAEHGNLWLVLQLDVTLECLLTGGSRQHQEPGNPLSTGHGAAEGQEGPGTHWR